jgi:hypothetical protein
MAFVAMAFLWTGSQIPAYLYGGVPPLIVGVFDQLNVQFLLTEDC